MSKTNSKTNAKSGTTIGGPALNSTPNNSAKQGFNFGIFASPTFGSNKPAQTNSSPSSITSYVDNVSDMLRNEMAEMKSGEDEITMKDVLRNMSNKTKNIQRLTELHAKLGNVENKAIFTVHLITLNSVEWKLIGKHLDVINREVDARIQRIKDSVKDVKRAEIIIKRVNNHREILKSLSGMITLTAPETDFLTITNVMRAPGYQKWFDELKTLPALAYVKKGENVSLEYAQNTWIPKIIDLQTMMNLITVRNLSTLKAIKAGIEKRGTKVVDEGTPLTSVTLDHHPKYWATLINPRNILVCRLQDGAPLDLKTKESVLVWIAQMEALFMNSVGKYSSTLKFNFRRFETTLVDGRTVSQPTEYWKQLVSAYKDLNRLLRDVREDKDDRNLYVAWNDVEMGEYSPEAMFDKI